MDFSFTQEQEDLRRETRTFLDANPEPTDEQLADQGWVGFLASDDATFLDAAVLFEELGRSQYEGGYIRDEVGDDRNRLLAALALEAVGIGAKAVEFAVAYVSDREQFGKKIGTYQAVSHAVVDAYVGVELARSLAYWAAWAVAEGDEQAELACAAAKSQAAEAAVRACETFDPGARRHRLHLGAPAAPLLQARPAARERARLRASAPRGDRGIPVALVTGTSDRDRRGDRAAARRRTGGRCMRRSAPSATHRRERSSMSSTSPTPTGVAAAADADRRP